VTDACLLRIYRTCTMQFLTPSVATWTHHLHSPNQVGHLQGKQGLVSCRSCKPRLMQTTAEIEDIRIAGHLRPGLVPSNLFRGYSLGPLLPKRYPKACNGRSWRLPIEMSLSPPFQSAHDPSFCEGLLEAKVTTSGLSIRPKEMERLLLQPGYLHRWYLLVHDAYRMRSQNRWPSTPSRAQVWLGGRTCFFR
jgi:hypothetical protein